MRRAAHACTDAVVLLSYSLGMQHFDAGPRKDPAISAANLVTRMFRFLEPELFAWEQDKGGVLGVSEMTNRIGKLTLLSLIL